MTVVLDVVASVLLLAGAFLAFAAGLGLVRFPDLLSRMHTATKPQVLGLILLLAGLAIRLRETHAVWMLVLVILFQLLTSPVAAHMVARAGYRTGKVDSSTLVVDELTRDLEAAEREAAEREAGERESAERESAVRESAERRDGRDAGGADRRADRPADPPGTP